MTRIIAGEFGGRRLGVPARGTRPTTDRVREALFSRLDHAGVLAGARVLDLYAGSGALGLEALSRGARSATLVESGPPAARVLAANVRELGVGDRAVVVKERVLPFLTRTDDTWDVVFMDPPYDIAPADLDAALSALAPRLSEAADVVVEGSTRAPEPTWPTGLGALATRDYGETRLHYATRIG